MAAIGRQLAFMIIQIYEIQSPAEAEKMVALGVDHVGSVVLSKSEWRNPGLRDTVRTIQKAGAKSCLIPLFNDLDTVQLALDYYRPNIVHFCQALTVAGKIRQDVSRFVQLQRKIKERFTEIGVMRTIPIAPEGLSARVPTLELAERFVSNSDFFLTDTLLVDTAATKTATDPSQPVDGFVGITGQTCDWQMARRLVSASRIPVILAGGLGPDNVASAIAAVQPAGVDSCTGTNAVGADGRPIRFQKDTGKVRAMVQTARAKAPRPTEKESSNPC